MQLINNNAGNEHRNMLYLESHETDPAFNLALEQYAFDTLSIKNDIFMLWQNHDAVIVGLHQNTMQEVNMAFINDNNIPVIRRLSGGGAVFHDGGNLNFTFITYQPDASAVDFESSCKPMATALISMGVPVVFHGRNDMTVDMKKFSGNARYYRNKRLMHHGTILFDVNLKNLAESLSVSDDKLISKGVKSVRARVTNLSEYLNMTVEEFWEKLRQIMAKDLPRYELTRQDIDAINIIKRERYSTWEWNYGVSPGFSIEKKRRLDNFGAIRIAMEVSKGRITSFATDGDYFGVMPYHDIAAALHGVQLERNALLDALSALELNDYYENLTAEQLVSMILE